jgi:hypothetical protein
MGRVALTDVVEQLPQGSSVRTSSISGITIRSRGHKGSRDKIFSLENCKTFLQYFSALRPWRFQLRNDIDSLDHK